jgi:hypothetical protein
MLAAWSRIPPVRFGMQAVRSFKMQPAVLKIVTWTGGRE